MSVAGELLAVARERPTAERRNLTARTADRRRPGTLPRPRWLPQRSTDSRPLSGGPTGTPRTRHCSELRTRKTTIVASPPHLPAAPSPVAELADTNGGLCEPVTRHSFPVIRESWSDRRDLVSRSAELRKRWPGPPDASGDHGKLGIVVQEHLRLGGPQTVLPTDGQSRPLSGRKYAKPRNVAAAIGFSGGATSARWMDLSRDMLACLEG